MRMLSARFTVDPNRRAIHHSEAAAAWPPWPVGVVCAASAVLPCTLGPRHRGTVVTRRHLTGEIFNAAPILPR